MTRILEEEDIKEIALSLTALIKNRDENEKMILKTLGLPKE